jgi:hypothetical protein
VGTASFNNLKLCRQTDLQLKGGTVPFFWFFFYSTPGRDASRRCGMQFSATSRAHDGPAIRVDLPFQPRSPVVTDGMKVFFVGGAVFF